MEQPSENAPADLSSVESITNLDTARMSLRWALERLEALEKAKKDLSEKLEAEAALRRKIEKEHEGLERLISQRPQSGLERERFDETAERLVILKLAGKLDLAALVEREIAARKLEEGIGQKRAELEKEQEELRARLQGEQEGLKKEMRAQAQARAEEDFARRQAAEQEQAGQREKLREREERLNEQEKSLERNQEAAKLAIETLSAEAARRKVLEQERLVLQIEGQQLRASLEGKDLELKQALLKREEEMVREKGAWREEQNRVEQEARWRLSRVEDLERKLADSEETARSARELERALETKTQNFNALLEEKVLEWKAALFRREEEWAREKAALLAAQNFEEQRTQERLARIGDLEKRLYESREMAHQAFESAIRVKSLEGEIKGLRAVIQAKDLAAQAALLKRDEEMAREKAAWLAVQNLKEQDQREMSSRVRELERLVAERKHVKEIEWEERLSLLRQEMEREKTEWLSAKSREEQKARERLARVEDLEKALADAEETARHYATGLAKETERRRELEKTVNAEEQEIEREKAVQTRVEQKAREHLTRIEELERRLADAEEAAKRSAAALTREAERRKKLEEHLSNKPRPAEGGPPPVA